MRTCDCVVIGGANIDLLGLPAAPLRLSDSNPGHVHRAPGGVGRNISENLALLGIPTCLVSAVGQDAFGDMLLEQTAQSGVDVSATIRSSKFPTALYAAVFDHTGELHVALADMEIMELVNAACIKHISDLIRSARIVVVDCNLSSETLAAVARAAAGRPLFADPVSGSKAPRLRPILGQIDTLKPNLLEASLLLPEQNRAATPAALTAQLRRIGVAHIFVSMGADGVWYDCARTRGWYATDDPDHHTTVTGAGDAFMAGLVYARLQDYGPYRSAACGAAAAAITLTGDSATNAQMSAAGIEAWIQEQESKDSPHSE